MADITVELASSVDKLDPGSPAAKLTVDDTTGSPFDDLQLDILAQGLADLRMDFLATIEAQLAPLRAELTELRALRDDLLTMIDAKRKALGRKRSTTRLLAPPK